MATKVYEVMKKDDKWIVRIKGNTKVIKSFATKPEAQEFVEGLSERQDGGRLFQRKHLDRLQRRRHYRHLGDIAHHRMARRYELDIRNH